MSLGSYAIAPGSDVIGEDFYGERFVHPLIVPLGERRMARGFDSARSARILRRARLTGVKSWLGRRV
jgi:hypothetical protein